jgi:hypothetical protein
LRDTLPLKLASSLRTEVAHVPMRCDFFCYRWREAPGWRTSPFR